MKKFFLIIALTLFTITTVMGQGISDAEVIRIGVTEKQAGASDQEIAMKLLQKGATPAQIQRLRSKYTKEIHDKGVNSSTDNAINGRENRMRVNNGESSEEAIINSEDLGTPQNGESAATGGRRVFGRDIFNKRNLTFEPQMNIATPQNYVLGPGDQLVVDVYGATQESLTLTISPDGYITVPDYGPIQVSGLTVASAQARIRSALGTYYSSSNIKTSLGQTRTITVNVMGEVVNPGTYTISAFATVFHALYMAGGVSDLGTLRAIKVYRQGKLITVVDVYEYILNGRLAGNVTLSDNDVIQVGTYDCIVDIEGRVKRPMAYEMRSDESLATLLRYSGGFAGDAYKKSVRLQRKNGKMKSVFNVEEFEMSGFKVMDGDFVTVDSIYDRYENMVEVKGAVFRQGMYQLSNKVNSVRTLIESAEGLTEEAMTSRAVIRRMKPNRTQEVISIDLQAIIDGRTADVPLQNEDVLFIPTQAEHQNLRTVTIIGEVIFPGTFEYADSTTVEDLIVMAGGLTDAAATVNVDVSRRIRDPKATATSQQISQTFRVELKDNMALDGTPGFLLQPYDVVQVRRSPVYRAPIAVSIEGEVGFQGVYTLESKNQRLSDIVKAAGGIMEGAYVRGARLERRMTEDERARYQAALDIARQKAISGGDSVNMEQIEMKDVYTVGIHLDEALANPGCDEDIELKSGDRLIVPTYNRTIRISGNVRAPNTVSYKEGKKYKYYVKQAGGFANRSKKKDTFIIYQNGTMAMAKHAKVEPGCEIVVPMKEPVDVSRITPWISMGTSLASLAAMITSIAYMITK